LLVRVTGTTGQPGVRLREAAWTVSEHSAICASLGGANPVAELWSASPTDDLLVVKTDSFAFSQPPVEQAPADGDGEVEANAGRRFALRSGWKRVSLSLGPGLVGLLAKGDVIQNVHWKPAQPLFETVDTDAEQILLLNTEGHPNRFALDVLPLAADQAFPTLSLERPYESDHVRTGLTRLRLADGLHRATLRIRGGEAVLVSKSGRVSRGADLAVDGQGGELLVSHGTGPVICWIDRIGSDDVLWPSASRPPATTTVPPAVVTLAGHQSRALRFERSSPGLIHFRSAGPLLITVKRPSALPDTTLYHQGADLAIYLPEGTSELLVRGLAGHPLAGQAEIGVTSVRKLEEGQGPELLLPPGDSRLFSFEVVREGEVGLAVRGESELVELELMSAEGITIETGSLMMPRLKPGVYLLNVRTSSSSGGPVKARPVVVGLNLPDSGPPQEVIQEYLRPPGEVRSFSSSAREVQSPRFAGESAEDTVVEEGETEEPVEEPVEEAEEPEEPRR